MRLYKQLLYFHHIYIFPNSKCTPVIKLMCVFLIGALN